MIVTAVDTDLNGGIACVDLLSRRILFLREMPVGEGPEGRQVDTRLLNAAFLACRLMKSEIAVVERAIIKPQSSARGEHMTNGIGTMHQTYGAVRALAELNFPQVEFAWPSAWKRAMRLSRDKDRSLELAAELYPTHAQVFTKKKRHGIAEAVLLADWYGRGRKSALRCTQGVD